MEVVHFDFEVRDDEAEKMALQVQKAKLEVTSDKHVSYRVSIHVACLPMWQNKCKLTQHNGKYNQVQLCCQFWPKDAQ
jgi:hypothetical protein